MSHEDHISSGQTHAKKSHLHDDSTQESKQQQGRQSFMRIAGGRGPNMASGGSRIFARGVRQLVPLECPKPLHALSPSDR